MPERKLEKKFCYLLLYSLIIHAALFLLLANLPPENRAPKQEPFMVDLERIPLPPVAPVPPVLSREKQQVESASPSKGETLKQRPATQAMSPDKTSSQQPVAPSGETPLKERSPKEALFRRKGAASAPDITALYPGAARLERLEESYRKRYGADVAEGDTNFLNDDDIRFGSFKRRFVNSVLGVWRYPEEAAKLGVEGIVVIMVTFNRRGEMISTELLQSSGSKLLDDEALRALKLIGPLGALPKAYEKDTYKLLLFFHYGIIQGAVRTLR